LEEKGVDDLVNGVWCSLVDIGVANDTMGVLVESDVAMLVEGVAEFARKGGLSIGQEE
jgi:hypothetical protein